VFHQRSVLSIILALSTWWIDEEIHSFASSKLKKKVESMAAVGEQDLARIARMIRAESKKR
jgi:hypothetical protein